MSRDGSNRTNLTNDPARDYAPAWSPDGTKIAFATNRDGSEIYVMNADGSNQTNITNTNTGFEQGWPDWQRLPANAAPTITSLRPPPGSTTTDRTPITAATVSDQQTNLAKSNITLVLDDVTIRRTAFSYNQSTDRMTYIPEKKLSLGRHAVKVIAEDGSGLSTTKRWSFTTVHP
jgi:dipeptidyl aminopeptidase/acylaminoacyl peptidase